MLDKIVRCYGRDILEREGPDGEKSYLEEAASFGAEKIIAHLCCNHGVCKLDRARDFCTQRSGSRCRLGDSATRT